MSKEILSIPEENLEEVMHIIRRGIRVVIDEFHDDISDETISYLEKWCDDMEEYLERLQNE